MATVRRALAFPFYLAAFIFHLLTALFTVIAQKIAGDESSSMRRHEKLSVTVVCCIAIAAIPAWVASRPIPTVNATRLVVQTPMDYRGAKTNFLPEQIVWVKPLIRLTACIFAENVIRHHFEPQSVEFAPCGDNGKINTTLEDNYIDMTVSGMATVGKTALPFVVTLQHYPPSTDEDGFIVTDLKLDPSSETLTASACPTQAATLQN